ncbi:hypothetical protein V8E54_004765 [Elaphomyces granulatus]
MSHARYTLNDVRNDKSVSAYVSSLVSAAKQYGPASMGISGLTASSSLRMMKSIFLQPREVEVAEDARCSILSFVAQWRSSDNNLIRMPALAQGNLRKPLPGVKVLEEMPSEIVINIWRSQRFPVNALMEVNGFLIVKDGKWEITAKSLRVQPGDPDNKDVYFLPRRKPSASGAGKRTPVLRLLRLFVHRRSRITGVQGLQLPAVLLEVECPGCFLVERPPLFRSPLGTPASLPSTERMPPDPFSPISLSIAFCPGYLAGGRLISPREFSQNLESPVSKAERQDETNRPGGPPSQAMRWELTLCGELGFRGKISINCSVSHIAREARLVVPELGLGSFHVSPGPSLCVVVSQLNNAPTKAEPADKTPADSPMTPRRSQSGTALTSETVKATLKTVLEDLQPAEGGDDFAAPGEPISVHDVYPFIYDSMLTEDGSTRATTSTILPTRRLLAWKSPSWLLCFHARRLPSWDPHVRHSVHSREAQRGMHCDAPFAADPSKTT